MLSHARLRRAGLLAGPLLALVTYGLLPENYTTAAGDVVALDHAARVTAAVAVWMGLWWLSEAVEIAATALLPVALFPLLGAASVRTAAAPYAHELVFLFLGGFLLALAMERWGLHRRVALGTLRLVGSGARRVVGGFMLVTAGLSMWVSNTATTILMLPIARSVIELLTGKSEEREMAQDETDCFVLCLLLGIAYSASIGGVGTLIGTPPNLFLASFLRDHLGEELSFVRWMAIGLPFVALFLPITWLLLTRLLYPLPQQPIPGAESLIRQAYRELGPVSREERWVTTVFLLAAGAWLFRPLLASIRLFRGLTDAGIAVLAAVTLFVLPARQGEERILDWKTAENLPWGIMLLFGGGLSLARNIDQSGLGAYLGHQAQTLAVLPPLLVVAAVTTVVILLTEMASNTATTTTFVPILAGLAPGLRLDPHLLVIPATVAASCAFMMPVATPPNAIVFGTGRITIPQMARAGMWLNLLGIGMITALAFLLFQRLL